MEKELELLEEMLMMQEHNLQCYSKNRHQTEPKEGYEKEWHETKEKIEQLVRISKVVYAESNALKEDDRKNLASVAERLLNDSASAYVTTDADLIELRIIDGAQKKVIARFEIKKAFEYLIFKNYQFY